MNRNERCSSYASRSPGRQLSKVIAEKQRETFSTLKLELRSTCYADSRRLKQSADERKQQLCVSSELSATRWRQTLLSVGSASPSPPGPSMGRNLSGKQCRVHVCVLSHRRFTSYMDQEKKWWRSRSFLPSCLLACGGVRSVQSNRLSK